MMKKEIVERTQPMVHDSANARLCTNVRHITRIGICAGNLKTDFSKQSQSQRGVSSNNQEKLGDETTSSLQNTYQRLISHLDIKKVDESSFMSRRNVHSQRSETGGSTISAKLDTRSLKSGFRSKFNRIKTTSMIS